MEWGGGARGVCLVAVSELINLPEGVKGLSTDGFESLIRVDFPQW